MRYKRLELVSQAKGHEFESRLPLKRWLSNWTATFFRRQSRSVQRVAPRQTCLWSVVVCYANIRACCAIVSEKRFSPHRPSIPTIFDCNNLPSVCSRLLPPFESRCCVFDNLSRYRTSQKKRSIDLFFVYYAFSLRIGRYNLGQSFQSHRPSNHQIKIQSDDNLLPK